MAHPLKPVVTWSTRFGTTVTLDDGLIKVTVPTQQRSLYDTESDELYRALLAARRARRAGRLDLPK